MTTQEQEYSFTPGPWSIATHAVIGKHEGKTTRICTMTVRRSASLIPKGKQVINAKLIAKSPDMFLLIRDLRDAMDVAEIPPVNNDLYKRMEEILKVGKV